MIRAGAHLVAVALAVLMGASLAAQTADDVPATPPSAKAVPPSAAPHPFSAQAPLTEPAASIEFRPADQMSERDRLLAANAESSVAERAAMDGIELEQGNWSFRQIVCPALPNHLFLQYARNSGTREATVFSASVPRKNEGRVRIIPILKRGYSLFSPAPINALTIAAFNRIRAEEPAPQRSASWLGNGLCYAALAGAHPRIGSPDEEPGAHKPIPELTAILQAQTKGGEIVKFCDVAASPRPMEWTMTFASSGKLMKATKIPAPLIAQKPVPDNSPPQR